jgi:hypothetical protein
MRRHAERDDYEADGMDGRRVKTGDGLGESKDVVRAAGEFQVCVAGAKSSCPGFSEGDATTCEPPPAGEPKVWSRTSVVRETAHFRGTRT